MPYLNIDDGMDEHPKIDLLSDRGYRLLMSSLHYCARNLTDGYVPLGKARRLTATGSDAVAKELVTAGVWHDLGEGCDDPRCIESRTCQTHGKKGHYLVHDYLQWNHSKHWWDTRRAEDAERKKKARAAKAARQESARNPSGVRNESERTSDRTPDGIQAESATSPAYQTRTDQNRTNPVVAPTAVDGSSSVTEIQTARDKRAASGGKESIA